MTQTPQFVFDRIKFVKALDSVWDFNKSLFDCIAGICPEDTKAKMAFQDVETVMHDVKKFAELWRLQHKADLTEDKLYLHQVVFFAKKNPEAPQTKALIDLWKAIYTLFPHKDRPLDSVAGFAVFGELKNILPDTKAQYYALHAFAHNAGLTKEADIKRALTVLAKNENSTIVDLKEVLNVRDDMDDKIAREIIAKSEQKLEQLQKLPESKRDNRLSGEKGGLTKYEIAKVCEDGIFAADILMSLEAKVALDAKQKFKKVINEITQEKTVVDLKPGETMPDINDLSQFPHYAKLLQQVKEQEK